MKKNRARSVSSTSAFAGSMTAVPDAPMYGYPVRCWVDHESWEVRVVFSFVLAAPRLPAIGEAIVIHTEVDSVELRVTDVEFNVDEETTFELDLKLKSGCTPNELVELINFNSAQLRLTEEAEQL